MGAHSLVPAPDVGDILGGKYRIDALIGEGAMGRVFAATQELTGKRVALKWLQTNLPDDANATQRLIREAQACARIHHPNVVDVYDVGQHKGCVYLVMEHLFGLPLSVVMEQGPLEPEAVVRLLMPALRGVAAAHKLGVIHRDLKPDNIFLCRGEDDSPREAKVLDFGIAKMRTPDGQSMESLTKSGALLGTPYYLSPEQATDPRRVDHRTDVYAFGVILFEALAGRLPFRSEHVGALLVEINEGERIRLRELRPRTPAELEAVVTRAMAREPADRYPDIESLAHALARFAPGVSFHADPTGGHSVPATSRGAPHVGNGVDVWAETQAGQDIAASGRVGAQTAARASSPLRESISIDIPMHRRPLVALWLALIALGLALAAWAWLTG